MAGKPVKITGAWPSRRGPVYVAYVFVFLCGIIICRLHKLTLSVQAKITVQLSVSLSDLVSRFLARPSLLREEAEKVLHRGLNPFSPALELR
jgi:hypothetical protein